MLVTGCTDAGDDAGEPVAESSPSAAAPSPSPSPSPTPSFTPVQGAVEVDVLVSGRPDRLGFPDNPPTDMDVVRARAAAVGGVLDRYLDEAQRGQPDLAVIRAVWLDDAEPTAAEVLRTGLTNPDNPVTAARYDVTVHVEPEPVLAAVRAAIDRQDGTTVTLELVFDITADQPQLQLVGGPEVA